MPREAGGRGGYRKVVDGVENVSIIEYNKVYF